MTAACGPLIDAIRLWAAVVFGCVAAAAAPPSGVLGVAAIRIDPAAAAVAAAVATAELPGVFLCFNC